MGEAYELPPLPEEPTPRKPSLRRIYNTPPSAKYQPASKNRRVLAFFLDAIISAMLVGFMTAFISYYINQVSKDFGTMILQSTLQMFYWVGLTLQFGATPGKKIFGLRIMNKDSIVAPTIRQLLLRESVGRFCSTIVFFVGYFWCMFNKEHRTWHDMMSKTIVVDYRDKQTN